MVEVVWHDDGCQLSGILYLCGVKQAFVLFISFVMLTGSMLPNNDVHELVKAPALVKHYFDHDKGTEQLSFLDFLVSHYTDQNEQSKSDEHKNLPFFNHCSLSMVYTCHENTVPDVKVPEAGFIPVEYAHPIYYFQTQNNIFQPPRS